jgi:hypothetical protein
MIPLFTFTSALSSRPTSERHYLSGLHLVLNQYQISSGYLITCSYY